MKQSQRNNELAAFLSSNLKALKKHDLLSTKRRGERTSVCACVERMDDVLFFEAVNEEDGWEVIQNETGFKGSVIEVLQQMLDEVTA